MAPSEQPDEGRGPQTVEITRYPNRRLYDRSQGRYVTLQEIAATIQVGKTVVIRDSKSGEDLTRSLLTQIILEQYPERMALVPVAVLHSMIQSNGVVLGFLRDYFQQLLGYLELVQRSAAIPPFVPPLNWMKVFLPQPVPSAMGDSPAFQAEAKEAESLVRRVAELEKRLDEMNASARKMDNAR